MSASSSTPLSVVWSRRRGLLAFLLMCFVGLLIPTLAMAVTVVSPEDNSSWGDEVPFHLADLEPDDQILVSFYYGNTEFGFNMCEGQWDHGSSSESTWGVPGYLPDGETYCDLPAGTYTWGAFGGTMWQVEGHFTITNPHGPPPCNPMPCPPPPVTLMAPETLHSNGADLQWTRYDQTDPAFDRYEVHRSPTEGFTPSAQTLVATIADVNQTRYRDTTAAAAGTFYYRIVAGGFVSAEQQAVLPADGLATKTLQPDAETGRDATIRFDKASVSCKNEGATGSLQVGSSASAIMRSLVHFDLRDLPAGATVNDATLSLWHPDTLSSAGTVRVHAVDRDWHEGSGDGGSASCTGDGATWYEAYGGVGWSDGAAFSSGVVDSVAVSGTEAAGWHTFDVSALVEDWASGERPNLGLLAKLANETAGTSCGSGDCVNWTYTSSDGEPLQRPRLELAYEDGSHALPPQAALAAPLAGSTLSGEVSLAAEVADDGHVAQVQFKVDSTVVSTDTQAPFAYGWDSSSISDGNHDLRVVATDDAGNTTTSDAIPVTVDNSAPPSTAITSQASTVDGTPTVTATASDDGAIDKVEFFADGTLVGTDTASPYSASWDTLDPAQPFYDGEHELTTRAYSDTGQVTMSTPVAVTVENATGGAYSAAITSSEVPAEMTYDPAAQTQETHAVDVTVENTGNGTFSSTGTEVRYEWYLPPSPGEAPTIIESDSVQLGANLTFGQSHEVRLDIAPPPLPGAMRAGEAKLRIDLVKSSTGTSFSSQGNKPEENDVRVAMELGDRLGLERYYQYDSEDLGGGMTNLVNVANGNSIVRFTPFTSPGRGLSTVLALTYNSLEKNCECPAGNNFSLSISSLTRLGLPLDIHPNDADIRGGENAKWIRFTDGDGTSHVFDGDVTGGVTYWKEPPGTHLYLRRKNSTPGAPDAWALTRPDRVTFYYDEDGYPTSVEDKNGNELTFTLEAPPDGDPQNVKKRVAAVTDAGERDYTITYYTQHDPTAPHAHGRIKTITDHDGSKLTFEYFLDGNLMRITQTGGETQVDGEQLPDRQWIFSYVSKSNTEEPVVDDANERKHPDPRTNNQSTSLYSVIDPRGHETIFTYKDGSNSTNKWKLATRTNRAGKTTSFSYDITTRKTTVTAPLSRVTDYHYMTDGSVDQLTEQVSETVSQETDLEWSSDRQLVRVDEPGGGYTTYDYNANGLLTEQKVLIDAGANSAESDDKYAKTVLEYGNFQVDGNDVSGKWRAGRSIPHISQISSKTDPNGFEDGATPENFEWTFGYDENNINLESVTDPLDHTTTYDWNDDGTLASILDANEHATTFGNYDANGLPGTITDALNHTTTLEYTPDGLTKSVRDPNHQGSQSGNERTYKTVLDYDAFQRVRSTSTPKAGDQIIWAGVKYDENDNVVLSTNPLTAGTTFAANGPKTETLYDDMDRPVLVTGPDRKDGLERTRLAYDDAGRLQRATRPKGVPQGPTPFVDTVAPDDFTTEFLYDPLDRVITQIRYPESGSGALKTHYCYDVAGNLSATTAPRATLSSPECGNPNTDFTTRFTYDIAHRRLTTADPEGRAQTVTYDSNGNVKTATDGEGISAQYVLDPLNRVIEERHPFVIENIRPETDNELTQRTLVTGYVYDPVGNLIHRISPRAYNALGTIADDYDTMYFYDAANRLVRTRMPTAPGDPIQSAISTYRAYDANGNLTLTSLHTTEETDDPLTDLPVDERTLITYYADGTIESVDDPGNAVPATDKVFYDTRYTADGSVKCRLPSTRVDCDGTPEEGQTTWVYDPDGQVRETRDRKQSRAIYDYDLNNNLTHAVDTRVPNLNRVDVIVAAWDGFDRLDHTLDTEGAKDSRITTYEYDLNGNVLVRLDNATPGTPPTGGRKHEFTYDQADLLHTQIDRNQAGATDDQRITSAFFDNGWLQSRVVARNSAVWDTKETTTFDPYANGQTYRLETRAPSDARNERQLVRVSASDGTFTLSFAGQTSGAIDNDASLATITSALEALSNIAPGDVTLTAHPERGAVPSGSPTHFNNFFYAEFDANLGDTNVAQLTIGDANLTPYGNPATHLATVRTTRGGQAQVADPGQLLEQHTISYLDSSGRFANGNRTKDTFTLQGPDDRVCDNCTTSYTYDPRDRLTAETSDRTDPTGPTVTTTYTLNPHGNIICTTTDGTSIGHTYVGDQLRTDITSGCTGTPSRQYIYDAEGNLDCIRNGSTATPCETGPSHSQTVTDYGYDYLNHLTSSRTFAGGTPSDTTLYDYDALGRPVQEQQRKGVEGVGIWRTTELAYLGLTDQLAQEDQFEGKELDATGSPTGDHVTAKTYSYDPFGRRVTLTNDPETPTEDTANGRQGTFTYGYDAHGSVSLLLDEDGGVQASYGYDAYGASVEGLTKGDNEPADSHVGPDDTLNPYRYSGKRQDSLSKTYDMGARRYDTGGRFLQQDLYLGSLANLTLSVDPLTQNRYALAGGNPVGYLESDGHAPLPDDVRSQWRSPTSGSEPGGINPPVPAANPRGAGNEANEHVEDTLYLPPNYGTWRGCMAVCAADLPAEEQLTRHTILSWTPGISAAVAAEDCRKDAGVNLTCATAAAGTAGSAVRKFKFLMSFGRHSDEEADVAKGARAAKASDDGPMLGRGGTQTTSTTLLKDTGQGYRIDVENPAPGVRPGQLHLQAGSEKYLYNFEDNAFEGLPSSLEKQIANDPAVANALAKARIYLNLPQ